VPGRHLTDHQIDAYEGEELKVAAAAKASLSRAMAYRIEKNPRLPSQ